MPTAMLLGGASLMGEHGPLVGPASQRHRVALLALLALSHPRPISRDRLIAFLWPERNSEHARNLLKQGVHALRRAFGEGAIVSAGDELYLGAEVMACDVVAFEAALAAGDPAEAVGLYAGPLLDGFHLPEAPEFEQRIDGERDRLRRLFVHALEALAEKEEARGDWSRAVERWRRVVTEEPYSGLWTVRLMEALCASGDRAGAIQHARQQALLLKLEFDAEPDERVIALAERLRTDSASGAERTGPDRPSTAIDPPARASAAPPTRLPPSHPLVGRRAEYRRLRAAWDDTANGRSQFALIAGEAGIGKTRLAEQLLEWASGEGIDVARTRSYATEGELAYAPLADLLRSPALRGGLEVLDAAWLAEVVRLLPELREARPDLPAPESLTERWQLQRLFAGLSRAVLARRASLLLLIDDLQWCDPDTLQWLYYLLRFDAGVRLLVVGTARADEVGADHRLTRHVDDLRRHDQLTEIHLTALDADETAALASLVAGSEVQPDAAARLFRETEGHPLFVVESVRAQLLASTLLGVDGNGAAGEVVGSPAAEQGLLSPRVQAVIRTRLSQLSPAARRLAGLAATIGRDFTLAVLSRACELDDGTALDALDELWQRRIVREHGTGRFDFSHDKLREVAYAEMGPVRRSVLHRRVAEALQLPGGADLDAVSGLIAGHYEKGGLPERAIPFYQRAAAAAQSVYANEEAIGQLERALELVPTLAQEEERGRRELSLRIALLPLLRLTRGWAAPEVGECAARARSLHDRVGTEAERFRVTQEVVSFQIVRGTDFRATLQTAEDALRLGVAQGDPCLLMSALNWVGITRFHRGEYAQAREFLERAAALYDRRCHRVHVLQFGMDFGVFSYAYAGHALCHLGYPDAAARMSRRALELSAELAHPFSSVVAIAYDAMLLQFLGEADAAAERAAEAVELSGRHGFPYYHAWGTILGGWAVAERHELGRGIALIREGVGAMSATGAELRRAYYASLLAVQCARDGQTGHGLALLEEALAFSAGSGEHWMDAELHRLRGELLLSRRAEEEREAEACFRRAQSIARRQEARLLDLRASVSLSRLLRDQQRREEAREALRDIHAWFTEGFDTADLRNAGALLAELS